MVEWRDKERNRFPFGPLRKKLTRFVRSFVRDPPTHLPTGVVPSRGPIRWWTRLYLWRGRSERVQTRRGQPTKEAETGRWEMERGVGGSGRTRRVEWRGWLGRAASGAVMGGPRRTKYGQKDVHLTFAAAVGVSSRVGGLLLLWAATSWPRHNRIGYRDEGPCTLELVCGEEAAVASRFRHTDLRRTLQSTQVWCDPRRRLVPRPAMTSSRIRGNTPIPA